MRLAPSEAAVQEAAAAAAAASASASASGSSSSGEEGETASPPPPPPPPPAPDADGLVDLFSSADLDAVLGAAGPADVTLLLSSVTWCRPCRAMAAPLRKLTAAYGPGTPAGVGFYRVYGNASPEAKTLFRDRLGTRATPTWFVFVGSDPTPAHSHTGANKAKLEAAIRAVVGEVRGEGALPADCLYPPDAAPVGRGAGA